MAPAKPPKQSKQSHQEACAQTVSDLFPDICLDYLSKVAAPLNFIPARVIDKLIEDQEAGNSYVKKSRTQTRKRKRNEDDGLDDDDDDSHQNSSDEEVAQAKQKYGGGNRPPVSRSSEEIKFVKKMISGDFPMIPLKVIQENMIQNGNRLMPTYLTLGSITTKAKYGDEALPWRYKKWPSQQTFDYRPDNLPRHIMECKGDEVERHLIQELVATRKVWKSESQILWQEWQVKLAEKRNLEIFQERGQMAECGCCFTDFPLNRLVRCDAEAAHLFCFDCSRRNAETQVGLSKYELLCMSTDECKAGFCQAERSKFISNELARALDMIEQETVLRLADIENLVSCPFCNYAVEGLPIEVDKELRCLNPDCGIVSCRHCLWESHIPKSCSENLREQGLDARREVEEAMTAALVRKCNKCKTPFVKYDGCNKMQCPRPGCTNVQCYVCSVSCDYRHFNDPVRGGRQGNCPLFDDTDTRHSKDIKEAEDAARKKVLEAHPDLDADHLTIQVSDEVAKAEAAQERQRSEHRRGREPWPALPAVAVNGEDEEVFRRQLQLRLQQVEAAMAANAAGQHGVGNVNAEYRWANGLPDDLVVFGNDHGPRLHPDAAVLFGDDLGLYPWPPQQPARPQQPQQQVSRPQAEQAGLAINPRQQVSHERQQRFHERRAQMGEDLPVNVATLRARQVFEGRQQMQEQFAQNRQGPQPAEGGGLDAPGQQRVFGNVQGWAADLWVFNPAQGANPMNQQNNNGLPNLGGNQPPHHPPRGPGP